MNYTKGEWRTYGNALGTWAVSTDNEPIAQVDRHFNAQLIVAAVNACIKLNPDNPMAVAESISDLHEALRIIVERIDGFNYPVTFEYPFIRAREALAKAEGK